MINLKKLSRSIKQIYKKLTDPHWRARTKYIKYYEKLPLNENAILLESEHGKKLDGNIFYILKYLSQSPKYEKYQIYVSSRASKQQELEEFLKAHEINNHNVHLVDFLSDHYMRLLASAKYLINDTSFTIEYRKKEGQIYLNTWHGTPLKNLGKSDKSEFYKMGNVQKNFLCSDYLLCPNEHTRKCIIKDYMLENISSGKTIMAGYPRNEAFFDTASIETIKSELSLLGKRVYSYMPTFRGSVRKGRTDKNDIYLLFFLYEIDKALDEDEILFVNIHPLARSKVNFKQFKHIQPFPSNYETYEFLNVTDVLITDYSSVFFDFACSGRKVILFPYDKEDYLRNRGMYFDMEDLPFPQVETVDNLLTELRSLKQYSDREFLETFCPWDGIDISQKLCDYVIMGQDTGLDIREIPTNGKENVLIYAGNLAANGITTSLRSLLNIVDLSQRNYYVSFVTEAVANGGCGLLAYPENAHIFVTTGDMCLTIGERIIRKIFKLRIIKASTYMKILRKRVLQEWDRNFGSAKFDSVIQFNGYDQEIILCLSTSQCRSSIFVHNDMLREIETRKSVRRDVLQYAYKTYDNVAVVTQDIMKATRSLSGSKKHLCLVKNAIDYQAILKKANEDITLESTTQVFPSRDYFWSAINSTAPKFITVGRFAPEKGHERLIQAFYRHWKENPDEYLFIMGGSSRDGYYQKTINLIQSLGLESHVILLCQVLNPYPIISACDYFILSSFYEGFGLVLVEADILGKPIVSTNIVGPHTFMKEHGGVLVENSEDGILNGLKMLAEGKIQPLNVDYEAYNQEVIQEFEQLFE